jgi:hypothetical protein
MMFGTRRREPRDRWFRRGASCQLAVEESMLCGKWQAGSLSHDGFPVFPPRDISRIVSERDRRLFAARDGAPIQQARLGGPAERRGELAGSQPVAICGANDAFHYKILKTAQFEK